jgi:hypothetical protein
LVEKILRRLHAALQIFGLHRGQVEEHHDQPVIAQLLGLGHHHGLAAAGAGGQAAHRGLVERRGHVHALKVEGVDLLLLAVLVDAEVALLQACTTRRSLRRAPPRWSAPVRRSS